MSYYAVNKTYTNKTRINITYCSFIIFSIDPKIKK